MSDLLQRFIGLSSDTLNFSWFEVFMVSHCFVPVKYDTAKFFLMYLYYLRLGVSHCLDTYWYPRISNFTINWLLTLLLFLESDLYSASDFILTYSLLRFLFPFGYSSNLLCLTELSLRLKPSSVSVPFSSGSIRFGTRSALCDDTVFYLLFRNLRFSSSRLLPLRNYLFTATKKRHTGISST